MRSTNLLEIVDLLCPARITAICNHFDEVYLVTCYKLENVIPITTIVAIHLPQKTQLS